MPFLKNESGATAIEYGLIAALISVIIISVLSQCTSQSTNKVAKDASENVTAINHTDERVYFALATRNSDEQPLLLNVISVLNQTKKLHLYQRVILGFILSYPNTAMALRIEPSRNASSARLVPLKPDRSESRSLCLSNEAMRNVLVSTSCTSANSNVVDFYFVMGGTTIYVIER